MAYRPYIWRKNNPEKRTEQKKRENIRRALRDKGILPKVGKEMNEEQKIINIQISNNDFTYWDSIKHHKGGNGGIDKQIKVEIKSPEYLIWYRAKESAKEYKREFNLEVEDIIIPTYCEETNVEISTDLNDSHKKNYYVLDRIVWDKGYVKNNVRVLSLGGLNNKIKELSFDCLSRDYTPKDKQKEIYDRAKKNAKKGKYEFNLNKEDIIIPTHCPYFGIELFYNKNESSLNNYYSIDRIDSSKGYVKGNIQIISRLANTMKNNATNEELITFAKNILRIHNPEI
jgi:hypothetical protein